MGVKELRKLQLGAETTPGTAVAATTMWRGIGALRDDREIIFADEDAGNLFNADRSYTQKLQASLNMGAIAATYEQLPYILEAAVKKVGTGASDGAGSDKVYAYPVSTTAQNTIQTYTIEGGDNTGAEKMEYAFVTDFTLSGQSQQALMMSANWLGRQTQTVTFAALTPITKDEVITFGSGALYVDNVGGTIGTTQVSTTLKSLTLKYTSGIQPMPSLENLYYSSHAIANPTLTLDMVLYWNASAIAEKANLRSETSRLIQLKWQGSSVTTPGTTYNKRTLLINLYGGKWTKFTELQNDNGHNVVTASYEWRYNLSAATASSFTVVNEVTALP